MYRRQLLVLALYVCNFLFYIVFIYWYWGWNVSIWWRIFISKKSWGINFPICSRQVGNLSKHNCWYQYWQLVKIFIYVGHYGIFLSLLFSKICTYVSLVTFLVVFYRTISFFKVFISSFTFSIVFYSSIFFLEFSFTKVFGFMLKVTVHLMFCLNSAPHYSHLILFPTIIRFVYIRRAQRR